MTPEVRAIADRLTWEGAILRFLAAILPEGGAERHTLTPGWTVQEAFAHLTRQEQLHADRLERFLRGDEPTPPGHDHPAWEVETSRLAAELPLEHWLDEISRQRARLYAMFGAIDDAALERPFSPSRALRETLLAWSGHYAEHAFEVVEVTPEVVLEPILVRWLLRLDPGPNEAIADKQRSLAARVRAALEMADAEDQGG